MIDLEEERRAAADRREQRKEAERLEMQARRLRREGEVTEEAARRAWPELGRKDRRRIVERAHEQLEEIRMSHHRPTDIITGPELVQLGAAIYREEPKLTARQVYERLQAEHGERIGISLSSWRGPYAAEARRLAGTPSPKENGGGPRPGSGRKATAARRKKVLTKKTKPAGDHPWRDQVRPATEKPREEERPGEVGMAGADGPAEPVASPAAPSDGPWIGPQSGSSEHAVATEVITAAPRAMPRPIVVVPPAVGSESAFRERLEEAGYVVVVTDDPMSVRVIEAVPVPIPSDAFLAAAARAISDTYASDVREKFGHNLAEAILAGREAS